MGPLDALWHFLNFIAPAWGVSLLAAALVKLLWWRGLRQVSMASLVLTSSLAGMAMLVVGLVWFGHDGRMATYGLLLLSTTLVLWWKGVRHLP
jgi:hypothetical protein